MTDEINIQNLTDDDLYLQMGDDLYDGIADGVVAGVNEALRRSHEPFRVMMDGLVEGMSIVGDDFRDGVLFVPEVLMAAKAMKAGMEVLRPLLTETGAPKVGTVVIGTVKGDIHDIGKNLVAMMMEGAGFEVINLGTNTDADAFIDTMLEHNADVIGMSALLTTTMPYMGVVIEELEKRDLRDKVVVLVGGAPLNEAFAEEIRADAYCRDAAVAVETAKKLLAMKKA